MKGRFSSAITHSVLQCRSWPPAVDMVLLPRLLMRMVENLVSVRPNRHYPRLRDDKPKKKKKKLKAVPTKNTTT